MARAVVTGGAGFVGSHLVARLLAQGHEVVVVDNLHTGDRRNLPEHPALRLVEHDVREPFDVPGASRVYHLACPASPPQYQVDPVGTLLTSVLGTQHALQLAERAGARLLLASTSEVYGEPEVHPQPEAYRGAVNPVGPRACYDEGKRAAEALVRDWHRAHGLDVRIARIFNTYGPRMALDDGRVVVNFVQQALRGEPLTVYGDGQQTRSLCYVSDLVDGLCGLMERTDHVEPVNLGNAEELTVAALAQAVLSLVPGSELVHEALPVDDPTRRCPDLRLAAALFGYTPRVSLAEGLARTVEDVRARLGRRRAPGVTPRCADPRAP
ncbi:MAG: UDP-glucuronic acid decarboxylase family protein [Myxococcota bacterium]